MNMYNSFRRALSLPHHRITGIRVLCTRIFDISDNGRQSNEYFVRWLVFTSYVNYNKTFYQWPICRTDGRYVISICIVRLFGGPPSTSTHRCSQHTSSSSTLLLRSHSLEQKKKYLYYKTCMRHTTIFTLKNSVLHQINAFAGVEQTKEKPNW